MAGKLVAKADVAVGPLAKMKAVDPGVAVGHYAVKVQEDAPVFVTRRQCEMLSIPSDAGRKKATCATGRVILVEWSFNTPIVWYVQLTPCRILKVRMLGPGGIPVQEAPVLVE